jgi:hypothetical protein
VSDAHLNSIHLPPDRREQFRQARHILMTARSEMTEHLEGGQVAALLRGDGRDTQRCSPHAAAPARWMLVDRHRSYPLQVGANSIGRLPDNDVVVEDPDISRRHCAILVHASQRCEVHDTASKNGTFVNGRRITGPTDLRAGDEIQMCTRRLVLRAAGDPEHSPTFCESGPY